MSKTPTIQKIATKEKSFVEEYLANGFNATQAYGKCVALKTTKVSTWNTLASTYLRRKGVQQFLADRLEQRKKEIHVDQNYVVRKYLEIVECDYIGSTQYLTKDQLDKMPENVRRLVTGIDSDVSTHTWNERYGQPDGAHEEVTEKYKVTFMCKNKALEALAKHTGTFMKDNITLQGNIESKSFTDALKEMDI